jgi:hypothetical protein
MQNVSSSGGFPPSKSLLLTICSLNMVWPTLCLRHTHTHTHTHQDKLKAYVHVHTHIHTHFCILTQTHAHHHLTRTEGGTHSKPTPAASYRKSSSSFFWHERPHAAAAILDGVPFYPDQLSNWSSRRSSSGAVADGIKPRVLRCNSSRLAREARTAGYNLHGSVLVSVPVSVSGVLVKCVSVVSVSVSGQCNTGLD